MNNYKTPDRTDDERLLAALAALRGLTPEERLHVAEALRDEALRATDERVRGIYEVLLGYTLSLGVRSK